MATPLAVALSDLAEVAPQGTRVIVLHADLTSEDTEGLHRDLAGRLDLDTVRVEESAYAGVELPFHLSPATLNRLLIDRLLGPDLDRLVYMDADVLIRRDPSPLFDVPVEIIGAVRDAYHPWFAGHPEMPWRDYMVQPDAPVFNAGLLVIDLPQWRAESLGDRALDILRRRPLTNVDQDALNLLLAGQWTEVDMRWNLQSDHMADDSLSWIVNPLEAQQEAVRDPWIVHFTGAPKPWHPGEENRFRREWRASLSKTSHADWVAEPLRRPPGFVTKVRRRIGYSIAGR